MSWTTVSKNGKRMNGRYASIISGMGYRGGKGMVHFWGNANSVTSCVSDTRSPNPKRNPPQTQSTHMKVIKRDGREEAVSLDKITARITQLCNGLDQVDPVKIAISVVQGVYDGVRTSQLDELAVQTATALSGHHPHYSKLAARIAISNLHKVTAPTILAIKHVLPEHIVSIVEANEELINEQFIWENDFKFDIFGWKTLERSYLVKRSGEIVERPQVLYMRVALCLYHDDLDNAFKMYHELSNWKYTMATPTLFNAGTDQPCLASCFLMTMEEDSIKGIYKTLSKCADISKCAGGIGISVSNIRSKGTPIGKNGCISSGLVPMLRVYNETARYVDQGGGKRKGAFAIYLEPSHPDVKSFLDLKKNHGAEELRARDLFYALWIPDLFMKRVKSNGSWSLFCPTKCPDLIDLYGDEYEARYEEYEKLGMASVTLPAQELWFAILDSQIETGTPYMLYKDAANKKSNQKHLGTIRNSNLCTEIMQFCSKDEIAVCNLGSLSLPAFLQKDEMSLAMPSKPTFSFEELGKATANLTRHLNRVIDLNLYPREEAEKSNFKHRPVGIGVQGLANVFATLGLSFDSPEARQLNRDIFETIYFHSVNTSVSLAAETEAFASYDGSPTSQGLLQFDLWGVDPGNKRHDWTALKQRLGEHGIRNSLLVAPMPTASTAQIMGNNECFEPFTSNMYVRRVLSGEYIVINDHLVKDLEAIGLWTEDIRQSIIAHNGSVQNIDAIPNGLKKIYKTVWELSMKTIIDMAADRGPFVCQSQSMNLFMQNPNHAKLTSMHFYAWEKGLKTGQYYLRTTAPADPVKVTVPVKTMKQVCTRDSEGCVSCSA